MSEIEEVLNKITKINCPVDEFEDKILEAYEGFSYEGEDEIVIERTEDLDRNELQAYSTYVNTTGSPEIIVYASEGSEHYVKAVEDAYISE